MKRCYNLITKKISSCWNFGLPSQSVSTCC